MNINKTVILTRDAYFALAAIGIFEAILHLLFW